MVEIIQLNYTSYCITIYSEKKILKKNSKKNSVSERFTRCRDGWAVMWLILMDVERNPFSATITGLAEVVDGSKSPLFEPEEQWKML